MVGSVPNFALRTSSKCTGGRSSWDVDNACNLGLGPLKVELEAQLRIRELLKVVEIDSALAVAVSKPRIIFEPVNVHDFSTVACALQIGRVFNRIEVVDVGEGANT